MARSMWRRLRWLAGRGWSAEDFEERHQAAGADAWGYRGSADHSRRADLILAALPKARFGYALEVGCAQGFLTERLAPRVARMIACDISAEAIRQARENCRAFAQVEFRVGDIRESFPGDGFDLCLFSDVLYYLSPREIDAVLGETARRTAPDGALLIVNEWSASARGLTPPSRAFARLDGDARWRRVHFLQLPLETTTLSLGLYRRMGAPEV